MSPAGHSAWPTPELMALSGSCGAGCRFTPEVVMGDFGEIPFVHTPGERVLIGRGGPGRPEGRASGGRGWGVWSHLAEALLAPPPSGFSEGPRCFLTHILVA